MKPYQLIRITFSRAFFLLFAIFSFSATASAQVPDEYDAARTGTIGLRLDGGMSFSSGSSFENVNANTLNQIQPQIDAGIYYNFSSRLRAGIAYSYTRMLREQNDGTVHTLPGGGSESSFYRNLKTNFHGASLTGEYNLIGSGRISFYAGTGIGCLFATGNTYTMGVKNEPKTGGMGSTLSFIGHNDPHHYNAVFVPVTLSLEYAFLPQVALSFSAGYRFLPIRRDLSPKSQVYVQAGLRFNLWDEIR